MQKLFFHTILIFWRNEGTFLTVFDTFKAMFLVWFEVWLVGFRPAVAANVVSNVSI